MQGRRCGVFVVAVVRRVGHVLFQHILGGGEGVVGIVVPTASTATAGTTCRRRHGRLTMILRSLCDGYTTHIPQERPATAQHRCGLDCERCSGATKSIHKIHTHCFGNSARVAKRGHGHSSRDAATASSTVRAVAFVTSQVGDNTYGHVQLGQQHVFPAGSPDLCQRRRDSQ